MLKKLLVAGVASVAMASCAQVAGAEDLKPLRVLIGSLPTAGYVGPLFYAKDAGLYEQAGLDVQITVGKGSNASIGTLVAGNADIVVAAALAAILNADKGQKVEVIGSQLGRNGLGLFVPDDAKIDTLAGLEGKTVVSPNAGLEAVIRSLLVKDGGDPEKVTFTQVPQVPTMFGMYISGQADAVASVILGKAIIGKGRASQFYDLDKYGVSEPLFSWIVTPDYLDANEDTLRAFLHATYEATGMLNGNPELAVEPFLAHVPASKAEAVLDDYKTTLSYQCAPGETVIGRANDTAWTSSVDIYKSVGLVSADFDVTSIYTNKLFDENPVTDVACPQ